MAGSSKLQMCRNALLAIGDDFLTSFAVDSKGSTVSQNLYDSAYQGQLTCVRWRFAAGKATLGLLVPKPTNDFSFAFQLPADNLAVHSSNPVTNYEIFGDNLFANVNAIDIDYTFLVSEAKLPPYFTLAMEALLASMFAYPVTRSLTLAKEKRDLYTVLFQQAKTADAQTRPPDEPSDRPFVSVRS